MLSQTQFIVKTTWVWNGKLTMKENEFQRRMTFSFLLMAMTDLFRFEFYFCLIFFFKSVLLCREKDYPKQRKTSEKKTEKIKISQFFICFLSTIWRKKNRSKWHRKIGDETKRRQQLSSSAEEAKTIDVPLKFHAKKSINITLGLDYFSCSNLLQTEVINRWCY